MKEKLKNREKIFGAWTSVPHPAVTEMFGAIMKPDFVGIDMEHTTISLEMTQQIITAGQGVGTCMIPRVPSHEAITIRRLLDAGADGIMVPMVTSRDEVENIVKTFKYPPFGKRSFGVSRAQGYGGGYDEYTRTWNDKSILMIQIESIEGVEAADEILSCEHIDGVLIGPYDISGSLGVPGKLDDLKVLKACDRVIEACARHKKSCGTQIVTPDHKNVKAAFDSGYTFTVLSSDLFLIWKWSEQMKSLISDFRNNS
jgi:2-dehydro-3-deoxyglucarate aldolase